MTSDPFETGLYPHDNPVAAPDGSVIHELVRSEPASMVHASLPPNAVARAVRHRTVTELWYVLEGEGEIWRSRDAEAAVTQLVPGVALTIPVGTSFQFRAASQGELRVVIVTAPPWPGADEADAVDGPWEPADGQEV